MLCVDTFVSEAEAIALANDNDYGLASAVFTGHSLTLPQDNLNNLNNPHDLKAVMPAGTE